MSCYQKVKTIDEVKNLIVNEEKHDFVIILGGGIVSSKWLDYCDGIFTVFHGIDGTMECLTEGELFDPMVSNIGKAINNKLFFVEN